MGVDSEPDTQGHWSTWYVSREDSSDSEAPETIVMDANGDWRPSDSHADMWSLGRDQRLRCYCSR